MRTVLGSGKISGSRLAWTWGWVSVSVALRERRWCKYGGWGVREGTYETAEDFVAWFDGDLTSAIVDGIVDCGFAVGAESAV